MDSHTLNRVRELTESVATDIREYNEYRFNQRIEAEQRTIDVKVQEVANTKAVQLLAVEIENCEQLKAIEERRAKLKREIADYYKEFLFWAGVQLSRATPALVIVVSCSLIAGSLGVLAGLNLLPSTVGCPSVNSWCYQWRLNKETTVVPELPANDDRNLNPNTKPLPKNKNYATKK